MFAISDTWKTTYPEAAVGVLALRNVANPRHHPALDERKQELERTLRSRFSNSDRASLKALPTIQAYNAYYKRYKKSYHVQLQLESIVFKGKSIPRVSALVEAMFMTELKNQLLTAGHDLDVVQLPAQGDTAQGGEIYVGMSGREQILKQGDMMISDARGVISSILYGPDQRTRITPETKGVLFTVYAPPGIEPQTVLDHLQDIRSNVILIAPEAEVILQNVFDAG
jgi:DNA/RNA-binding domain of Phe-tRNA-synthetase-like protein